jgi:hypothetical protein
MEQFRKIVGEFYKFIRKGFAKNFGPFQNACICFRLQNLKIQNLNPNLLNVLVICDPAGLAKIPFTSTFLILHDFSLLTVKVAYNNDLF